MRSAARALLAAMLGALTVAGPAAAAVVEAPARPGTAAAAIAAARPGDTVILLKGTHPGPLRIDRAIALRGEDGAVVDGGGRGTVIRVVAPGASIADLTIQGGGRSVEAADAAIHVFGSHGVALRGLRIRDVLYGIYAERSESLSVSRCTLTGRAVPLQEFGDGNGIHLWYSSDARLDGNAIDHFEDGIYLSFADRTRATGNRLRDCGRYGLHTMYCQAMQLVGNLFTRNVAGCAIMFTDHLLARHNSIVRNRGPRTYGFLLRDCSGGVFEGNQLIDNTVAMFLDGSNRNRIRENLFQDNGWGILLFSSCARNEMSGNTFLHNDYPIALDMRHSNNRFDDGRRGNYWSENAPYDLDGNGIADVPYSPVTAFAFISKQHPDLCLLAKSPAVAAITVAERVFPALRPSGAVDHYPLVAPPAGAYGPGGAGTAPRPAWPAAGAFGALMLLGIVGLTRRGRLL
jgi:nitrous oxidase accessory protein